MKRILINATHNEEIRVALCKDNHLYDFDLENRTREQKKSNIYKGHVTRVEPSLEAVFVEYGSQRQGFLPVREIASGYLNGNPRDENIRKLIREGDELIVQVEKEERGNKGAALSTYISLAGRYLVLMPNNPKGGGISRQISGKMRDDMKQMLKNLDMKKGMSVIIRTAGIGKTQEDLQHDLDHLLNIWQAIEEQNKQYASPRLVHQEAGVVTRAVRDYLRDDISEIWIDNEEAFKEAQTFVKAVMPKQLDKLRKYTKYEPMFARFGIEKQIETAYQREVNLPSGGSIVIDQTEALVSIDINSARSTKGADVSETAYHTNLEAADEIARQLRLRDMGGLIVIDFIDMSGSKHQREVEKRLIESTKYDRARVQFGEISKFGLLEMSRQRLRPSLEESTGYICPRCNGNGMIRDLRSLSLSIMRQIEQIALRERHGELQAEVPTDIAAFLLNEKRESLVYLEQDSGTRITILPHAHLETPDFNLHFNHQGFAPSSYERVTDTQTQETTTRGYEVDWQTAETERPEQQPARETRRHTSNTNTKSAAFKQSDQSANSKESSQNKDVNQQTSFVPNQSTSHADQASTAKAKTQTVAWLSNLFAPTPQAKVATTNSSDAAAAIESIVNAGAQSLGMFGNLADTASDIPPSSNAKQTDSTSVDSADHDSDDKDDRHSKKGRKNKVRSRKSDKRSRKSNHQTSDKDTHKQHGNDTDAKSDLPKREPNSRRDSRGSVDRGEPQSAKDTSKSSQQAQSKSVEPEQAAGHKNTNQINLRVDKAPSQLKDQEVVHLSLDDNQASSRTESSTKQPADDNGQKTSISASNFKQNAQPNKESDEPQNDFDTQADRQHLSTTQADVWQDVFAKRYVTALKYGQASNDPRVVRAHWQTSQASEIKDPTRSSNDGSVRITGTVGEFITCMLGDQTDVQADTPSRDKDNDTIRRFLLALSQYHTQAAAQTDTQTQASLSLEAFSFSNYGYDPLSASELSSFKSMVSSVAHTHAQQGKTSVAIVPIAKRADNDPRGQHPEYADASNIDSDQNDTKQNDSDQDDVNQNDTSQNDTTGDVKASDTIKSVDDAAISLSPVQAMQELLGLSVGQLVERVLGQAGVDLMANGRIETAFLQALNQPFDVLVSVAERSAEHSGQSKQAASRDHHTDKNTGEATSSAEALTSDSHSQAVTDTQQENLAKVDDSTNDRNSVEDDTHKDEASAASDKSPTSPESYRSMIENVAGQMASGTAGILNFVAPKPKKVPKSRTRKANNDDAD